MTADSGGRRLLLWLALVLGVQVVVLTLSADRVYSGSDAGGRAAAVVAAADRGSCDHDLGYWAAPWDPAARVHPIVNTLAVDDRFVQPTPIYFVCAASALTAAVDVDAALALSIAGVMAAAVGAWLLERANGGSGSWSLVLVGLVGPLAFYGTDLWEHAPAVGSALLGTGLFARALVQQRHGWISAVVSGAAWGLAATLRTETAIVAVSLAVGLLVVSETRAMALRLWRDVVIASAAGVVVLVGDTLLEAVIIGTRYRSDRSGGQVSGALDRTDGVLADVTATTVGLTANDTDWAVMGFGALFVAVILVLGAGVAGVRLSRLTESFLIAVVAGMVLVRLIEGPGFVPGMLAAAPVAVIGLWTLRRSIGPPLVRAMAIGATLSLPVVWAFQWRGNLIAQWGGRYVLLSGALLTVSGIVALEMHGRRIVRATVFGAAIALGIFGLVWKVERSTIADDVVSDLAALSCEDVLIITTPFIPREGGAIRSIADGELASGCRFLSARPGDVPHALDVARDSGADEVTVLTAPGGSRLLDATENLGIRDAGSVDLGSLLYERFEVQLAR